MRAGDRTDTVSFIERSTRLACAHIHQRTCPLGARETLADLAAAAAPASDLVALLTCHRVELYAAIPAGDDPREAIVRRLRADPTVLEGVRILTDAEAAGHLFRVAAGLDSAVLGEGQIANQVRRAYDRARGCDLDPLLSALFQRALHLARTLRAGTALGSVRRSMGSLAVDAALAHLEDPARATALVVGAGEIGKLAARALARRIGRVVIANRDVARAAELASLIGAQAASLADLPLALAGADVLISAADTRGTVLTSALLEPRARVSALVVVDIAVPRSVAEDARALPGIVYRDVDDLVPSAAEIPADVLQDSERYCADDAAAFAAWMRERERSGTIHELRTRADTIREQKLARALRHLGHLTERDRQVVGSLASALTHALLHEPIVRARRSREAERAARTLFGLGE